VKVTTHAHSGLARVYEESAADRSARPDVSAERGTDTARYLAAGARRAFLVRALDSELGERLTALKELVGPEANLIFESNRVLRHLQPDLCLALEAVAGAPRKSSFTLVERERHAVVRRARPGSEERFIDGAQPVFELAEFTHVSAEMRAWLRRRLA
jgi:hypothetical protein